MGSAGIIAVPEPRFQQAIGACLVFTEQVAAAGGPEVRAQISDEQRALSLAASYILLGNDENARLSLAAATGALWRIGGLAWIIDPPRWRQVILDHLGPLAWETLGLVERHRILTPGLVEKVRDDLMPLISRFYVGDEAG